MPPKRLPSIGRLPSRYRATSRQGLDYNQVMMRWLRLLPVFFAALCLPLHALAAATMPFCQLVPATATTRLDAAVTVNHAGCEMAGQKDMSVKSQGSCKTCGVCHLLAGGMMALNVVISPGTPTPGDFSLLPLAAFQSRSIEPLPKPPWRS